MLVLRRTEGQWIELTHEASGDMIRFRVYDLQAGRAHLAFDDSARNFRIERPERHERKDKPANETGPGPAKSYPQSKISQ